MRTRAQAKMDAAKHHAAGLVDDSTATSHSLHGAPSRLAGVLEHDENNRLVHVSAVHSTRLVRCRLMCTKSLLSVTQS